MNLYEAVETICKDYCKYPDIESGNKLADICDKCPMNKCEELRWADRKTNSSEIPNNCETCRFELYCPEMCEGCCEWDSHYEPKDEPQTMYYPQVDGITPSVIVKTEPTISKMEQVDELQTKDYCDICNHKGCEYCISDSRNPYCIPSNYEPQTEGNE